jgi:Zn-dependent oligopeptidase
LLVPKLAGNPEAVEEFLQGVAKKLMPKAKREMKALQELKLEMEGARSMSSDPPPEGGARSRQLPHLPHLNAWDVPFYTGMAKARSCSLDAGALAQYFPLDACLEGLG